MDKKTYEYMKERTEKFEALNKRMKKLESAKKNALFINGLGIRTNTAMIELPIEDAEFISELIANAIDLRIEKCKEEMEEI